MVLTQGLIIITAILLVAYGLRIIITFKTFLQRNGFKSFMVYILITLLFISINPFEKFENVKEYDYGYLVSYNCYPFENSTATELNGSIIFEGKVNIYNLKELVTHELFTTGTNTFIDSQKRNCIITNIFEQKTEKK